MCINYYFYQRQIHECFVERSLRDANITYFSGGQKQRRFLPRKPFANKSPPLVRCGLHLDTPPDLAPPDESPVALHSPAERDLLPDTGAHGRRQPDLGQVGLDCDDAPARREGTDVDHEHLLLPEL